MVGSMIASTLSGIPDISGAWGTNVHTGAGVTGKYVLELEDILVLVLYD